MDLQTLSWKFHIEREELHVWCVDVDNVPVLVRVNLGIPFFIHVKASAVSRRELESRSHTFRFTFSETKRKDIYYYGPEIPMWKLDFSSYSNLLEYSKAHHWGIYDRHIPMERRILTHINATFACKITLKRTIKPKTKISTLSQEYLVHLDWITPHQGYLTTTKPSLMVFDIECYSYKHKQFPVALQLPNAVYLISVLFSREEGHLEKHVLLLGDCEEIEGVSVERFGDEVALYQGFGALVKKLDPDIISGYNQNGFDFPYMNDRLRLFDEEWPEGVTRFHGVPPEFYVNKKEKARVPGGISGRVNVDMLKVVQSLYETELPSCSLNDAAKAFLGKEKHPISALQMFETYKCFQDVDKALQNGLNEDDWDRNSPRNISEEMFLDIVHPSVRQEVISRYEDSRREMTKVVLYCVQDSQLVVDLFYKLHVMLILIEFSNVAGVNMEDYFSKGTQHRGFSLIYDLAYREGFSLGPIPRYAGGEKYEGAIVQTPVPGVHDYVPSLDFKSLYPSAIMAGNTCYTTCVKDVSKLKKDQYSVVPCDGKEHYFVKKEVREGILPRLMKYLIEERGRVRSIKTDDELEKLSIHVRQWALKITANAMYGMLGVSSNMGKLPLREGAESITSMGRRLITSAVDLFHEKYGIKVVYGDTDSIMFTIPIDKDHPEKGNVSGKEMVALGFQMEEESKTMFGHPDLYMEFEKAGRMFCVKKKHYVFWNTDFETGELLPVESKGALKFVGGKLARKETCGWLRRTLVWIYRHIITGGSPRDLLLLIKEEISNMERGDIPVSDFVMSNKVKAPNIKESSLGALWKRMTSLGRHPQVGDSVSYITAVPETRTAKVGEMRRDVLEFFDQNLKVNYIYYMRNLMSEFVDSVWENAYGDKLPPKKVGKDKIRLTKGKVDIYRPVTSLVKGYIHNELDKYLDLLLKELP